MKKIIFTLCFATCVAFCGNTVSAQKSSAPGYTEDDYMKFKKETDEKITDNEKKIAELKAKKAKSNSEVKDEMFEARIGALEERNKNLRKKISDYKAEKDHSAWQSFKNDVNNDMKELSQSIKDMTDSNKK